MRSRDWLDGRVVVITGSARGIGFSTAKEFLRKGARVMVTDVDEAAAHRAADQLSTYGPVRSYKLDVTDRAGFAALIERVESDEGPVDVLVNNAGIMPIGPALDETESTSRLQMEINFFGVLNGIHAVVPKMAARGQGHVVNIASVTGKLGTPWVAVYSATKHAVVGLTEAIRFENRDTGVGFSYIMPALVNTQLIAGAGRPVWPPPAEPEDVAWAVVDAVLTQKVDVYVPRVSVLSAILPVVLPRRVAEWIGVKFGLADMFDNVDDAHRKAYRTRIFSALSAASSEV